MAIPTATCSTFDVFSMQSLPLLFQKKKKRQEFVVDGSSTVSASEGFVWDEGLFAEFLAWKEEAFDREQGEARRELMRFRDELLGLGWHLERSSLLPPDCTVIDLSEEEKS